ncbi:restriction endonuclease [Clostridiales Family XIII bacterium RF-744-FAT-WT-3]|uniref:Restriction endonuclease n=1 Tax=Baileyella intestinalis TaxID=2606709 RepID=A0A6A8M9Q8_9FIRM|nr:Z1 domain-containing protein [Baileyella intestinalis]MST69701.1 restriction endonuclease [Baileyella intestinalis]
MGKYFNNYLDRICDKGNPALAEAIEKTADDVVPKYIANFSYQEHVVSLLVGDIQSGKTSHMFGLMCAAADEGFGIFVLLTTNNILLQQQTYKRAEKDLSDFCICDENDYIKFSSNNMRRPAVIVLKKDVHVLRQWKNNLSSTHFVAGNPLFVVDDEADAASLNTKVNKKQQSTINKLLDDIKKTTSSSIYLEVTGTPQSILLQSRKSGWKPYFIYYFKPGRGYMGGDFFFGNDNDPHIVFTDNAESKDLLSDDEFPENGLKAALITHLITAAQIKLTGGCVCNFLIHPSVKTSEHSKFAEKIGAYVNELNHSLNEAETKESIRQVYESLKETKKSITEFDEIYRVIGEDIEKDRINILILNSAVSYDENTQYETGNNIVIGGNSLGRGVTFPQLQTIYYCRVAKNPQADTMWQHARMFGYDRDPDLMRVFMPPKLYKLFCDINRTNNSIISQIQNAGNDSDIKICYPVGIRPTRKNVLDNNTIGMYSGGVNYFPFYPINRSTSSLDEMLSSFPDGEYSVSLKIIVKILQQTGSEEYDWNEKVFEGFINSFIAENPIAQGFMIVRRNRDIAKGTGTLLSPNDRALGDSIKDSVVLTLYKVTGNKGWDGEKLWIPNIKLPGNAVYYSGDQS